MHKKILFAVFAFLLVSSCKNKAASNFEMASEPQHLPGSTQEQPMQSDLKAESKQKSTEPQSAENFVVEKATKIIKTGSVSLEVKNITDTKKLIDSIVKKHKAYFELDEYNQTDYSSNYNLAIRVTADKFDLLTNEVLNLNIDIKHKDINARDVTDEYVDTKSRMNSAKSYLERYKDLLKKAYSIKDIIELETKIQAIQMEIESYEGRIKYMDDQIAYSTLSINIAEKHEYFEAKSKEHFGIKIINAFKQGFDILLGLILGVITIWPVFLFLILPFAFRKKIALWWKNRKS